MELKFEDIVECLVRELNYRKGIEKELRDLKKERDYWMERAEPELVKRQRMAELQGEIRLLNEQG